MYSQTIIVALFAAFVEARFGQEQGNGAITAIGALTDLGTSGQAATLAGGSIQFLLAAANPCGKLSQADNIIAELGTSDRAIAAARGLVAAEQNFNPFNVDIPSVCSDPTLPTTEALRGVVPLIDPAVGGQDVENTNSKTSATTPFTATGLSVAQVMAAQGFTNFTAVALDGTKQDGSALGTGTIAAVASNSTASTDAAEVSSSTTALVAEASSSQVCGGTTFVTVTRAATSAAVETAAAVSSSVIEASATSSASAVSTDAASTGAAGTCTGSGSTLLCSSPAVGSGATTGLTGTFTGFVASTISGLDFGLCVPTMKFEAGLDGRAATAFTFQAQDPLCNKGQEEALNPSIITNRIHDQLTNACGANQAAKDATAAAQVAIAALGTRDVTTADAWNTMLGFDGANTNPDNAPVTGLVGHA